MCFDWNRLLRIKSLFTASVCHSNSETNTVNESTIFARVPFGEKTKLCHFLFLAVCLDQLTSCSLCRDICSQCIEHKILQSQRISTQYPFGGMIGPGNSVNLHNFFYRIEILRVHASFHDAYGFLMRYYERPPGYMYLSALCNVVPLSAFASFSHFLIGHFTGVLFWLVFKFRHPGFFSELVSPTVS